MQKPNRWMETMRGLSYLTQVGLSVAAPIILCLLGGLWLRKKLGLPPWVLLIAMLVGLISGLMSLWKFLQFVAQKAKNGSTQNRDRGER